MNRSLFLAATFAAVSLFGQSKPDLSGTWKLNLQKSDFGPLPPPESRIDVIVQTASRIEDKVTQKAANGPRDMTMVYSTDGSETTNKFLGQDVKSTGKWEGDGFTIQSKLTYQEQEVTIDAKWTAGADGKSLTEQVHFTSPQGEADQTLMFDRDAGGPETPAPAPAAPATPAAGTASAGTAHPNFSGTWKLNMSKSDFGPIPPPDSRTDKIEHQGDALKDSFESKGGPQGDLSGELSFTTDGKPFAGTIAGSDIKGNAKWDGAVLLVDDVLTIQGTDINIKSRWEISADGKLLTQAAHLNGPAGDLDMKYVFDKQTE
jgi:hypothetical protein